MKSTKGKFTEVSLKYTVPNEKFGQFAELLKLIKDLLESTKPANKNFANVPVMPSFLALRKKAGLTLRQVEKDTKISNAYLSQLETGKIDNPSYKIVMTLINYYTNAKNEA